MKLTNIYNIGIAVMLMSGCSKTEPVKNMDQLYKEQGIPVKVRTVEYSNFTKSVEYNNVISGLDETTITSDLNETISKIFVSPGDAVSKGDLILQFPTSSGSARYEQLKSQYEISNKSYERVLRLFESGGVSQQELDNAENRLNVDKANWKAEESNVQVIAPRSGVINQIFVSESESVKTGSPLFTISNNNIMKTILWISEDDISHVNVGNKVEINWQDKKAWGKISNLSKALDRQRKAFRAEVEFPNEDDGFLSGVTASIKLQIYSNSQAIVVPRHLIKKMNGGFGVWVSSSGNAIMQEVNMSTVNEYEVEISEGIKLGDQLITEMNKSLMMGTKLLINE